MGKVRTGLAVSLYGFLSGPNNGAGAPPGHSGERLVAYELGAKGDYFDGALRANVAGFYSDYRKRIVSRPATFG